MRDIEDKIIDALAQGESLTSKDIAKRIGVNGVRTVSETLQSLVQSQSVVRVRSSCRDSVTVYKAPLAAPIDKLIMGIAGWAPNKRSSWA